MNAIDPGFQTWPISAHQLLMSIAIAVQEHRIEEHPEHLPWIRDATDAAVNKQKNQVGDVTVL
jgi:hypothetical protein